VIPHYPVRIRGIRRDGRAAEIDREDAPFPRSRRVRTPVPTSPGRAP